MIDANHCQIGGRLSALPVSGKVKEKGEYCTVGDNLWAAVKLPVLGASFWVLFGALHGHGENP